MPADPRVGVLREIFRHIEAWRALYEIYGIDTLPSDYGSWSLWEIETLIRDGLPKVSPSRAQAIRLYLLENRKETVVAEMMGVPEIPIGVYATKGIEELLVMVDRGDFPGLGASESVA